MIKTFVKSYQPLLLFSVAIVMLIFMRICLTGTLHFGFLVWNIFLALLPLLFSHLAMNVKSKWLSATWVGAWLVFFPNSAYLLTDLVHLKMQSGRLFWLDLSILFVSGVYGLLLSIISLRIIEQWYSPFVPKQLIPVFTLVMLILCGYGIYLGRVERWNSWDIVTDPVELTKNIAHEVRHPFRFREAWAMSLLFGSILYMFYSLQRKLSIRIVE